MSEVLKHKIRKDLNRWSRKLLITVGLENIGRQLVGEEKWEQIYPPQQVWHQQQTSDFDPTTAEVLEAEKGGSELNDASQVDPSDTTEEETNEEKSECADNIFHFLPYWYFINRAFGVTGTGNNLLGNQGQNDHNDSSQSLLFQALDTQRLLFLQSLQQRGLENQNETSQALEQSVIHIDGVPILNHSIHQSLANGNSVYPSDSTLVPDLMASLPVSDEPLDLTQKNKNTMESVETNSGDVANGVRQGSLRIPERKNTKVVARPNQRTGRGYTYLELEAALQDIRSGKLGTRRAAVIYGIPRSTLRNKVYKMGRDRNRTVSRQRTCTKRDQMTDNHKLEISNIKDLSGNHSVESLGTVSRVKQEANSDYFLPQKNENDLDCEVNIDGARIPDGISREKKALKEWLHSKLLLQNCRGDYSASNEHAPASEISLGKIQNLNNDDSSEEGNSCDASIHRGHDVILKIPTVLNANSFSRPKRRCSNQVGYGERSTTCGSGSSIWNQNLKAYDTGDYHSSYDSEVDSNCVASPSPSAICENSMLGQEFAHSNQHSFSTSQHDSDQNEKKSRPKRGKYRNYDRDALLKAVKAVQNGEMSVHRAGSYYGVPHSTLEYKVKERHLLRRPKRKPGTISPKITQKSSPESSLSGSEVPTRHPEEANSTFLNVASDSNSLPLPSDLRESLSRFLNINAVYSSPSSPEAQMVSSVGDVNDNGNFQVEKSGPQRNSASPVFSVLGPFSRLGTANENSSLLDLSKKV